MKLTQGIWRVLFVVYCLVGGALIFLFTKGSSEVSTTYATVTCDTHQISFQVSGRVVDVSVDDNQRVSEGDVLARLDDAPYAAKVKEAEGNLAEAKAARDAAASSLAIARVMTAEGLASAEAAVAASQAAVNIAEADLNQKDFEKRQIAEAVQRNREAVSLQDEKKSITSYDGAAAVVEAAKAAVAESEALRRKAFTGPDVVVAAEKALALAEAGVRKAEAELSQAELELSYCTVRAPAAGYVSQKNVELGEYVNQQKPLMAIVALDDPWIVARFREPDIDRIKAGQKVTLALDAYPDQEFEGTVENLESGTQDSIGLLAQYMTSGGTGYFSWLMQRVPVKIRVQGFQFEPKKPWRLGLNAKVVVDNPEPSKKFFN
jgi:membrane fusion protein (multidrug efflux system)